MEKKLPASGSRVSARDFGRLEQAVTDLTKRFDCFESKVLGAFGSLREDLIKVQVGQAINTTKLWVVVAVCGVVGGALARVFVSLVFGFDL